MFPCGFAVTNSFINSSNELMVPGRVTSSCVIPQGAVTEAIEPKSLLGHGDIAQLSIGMNTDGNIELDKKSREVWPKEIHWVRAVRLSDDCHSFNLQLRLQSPSSYKETSATSNTSQAPELLLQTTKPVESGQELLLWFSEDIQAMLQIAFLIPANIQGQKKYVCTKCSTLYESPNPLKLHITLGCGKYSITTLWEKLTSILGNDNKKTEEKHSFTFRLNPEVHTVRQGNAIDLTTTTHHRSENLYRPYSQPSAFRPFRKRQSNTPTCSFYSTHPLLTFSTHIKTENSLEDQAQIETFVSSLGKSKGGHICLYCGKCYSRKYGLKIHIRTHTGYKPLKCKFCLRPFGDPSNLNKHVRLHAEGDTPYKCELCGKVLVRRRDLERHLKSRHMSEIHPGKSILEDSNDSANISEEEKEHKPTVVLGN